MADRKAGIYCREVFTRPVRSLYEHFVPVLINLLFNISYYFFELELPPAILPNDTFVFTMTVILGLLQLKYHKGGSRNPLESHPVISAFAITSLLLYGLAYGFELRFSSNPRCSIRFRNLVRWSTLLTGGFCLASMASFLFPDSVRPLIFVFYFIGLAAEMLYRVYQRFHQELRTSNEGWRRIRRIFTGIWRLATRCFTNQGPILPR